MSNFNLIVIGVIIVIVFVAVLVLAGVIPGLPGTSSGPVANLVMWGFLPKLEMNEVVGLVNDANEDSFIIKYFEKDKVTYEQELVNALASGTGPDIWVMTQDMILKHREKAALIPFTIFSERSFLDTFVDDAQLFLWKEGIIAVPFAVDPMVMYWNRDLFGNAGLVNPPAAWEEFLNDAQILTVIDNSGNILQSGAAMGTFSNIKNAKDLFSLLILQSGSKIVVKEDLDLVFGDRGDLAAEPVSGALTFYASFSNPTKVSYSWNTSITNSQDLFAAGRLAMYFGYASELGDIGRKNPHLNFDAALVPQTGGQSKQSTFGKVYAIAVSKTSPNVNKSVAAAFSFMQQSNLLSPVRRDLLAQGISDPARTVFYKAVAQSTAWLEPDSGAVDNIYKEMIESVVSGRKRVSEAVRDAKTLLQAEMAKVTP